MDLSVAKAALKTEKEVMPLSHMTQFKVLESCPLFILCMCLEELSV